MKRNTKLYTLADYSLKKISLGFDKVAQMEKNWPKIDNTDPALPSAQQKVNWKPRLLRQTRPAEVDEIGGTNRSAEVSAIEKLFRIFMRKALILHLNLH